MLRMSVLYPAGDELTFDWDYYTSEHMQLVNDRWGEHMARPAEVARGLSGVPKGDPAFAALTVVYFADRDALNAALKAGGMDIPNDIPNFYPGQPVMQVDEVVEA